MDVFAIQDEIAAAIVEKLHLTFGSSQPAVKRSDGKRRGLRGAAEARHHFSQFTPTARRPGPWPAPPPRALSFDPDYTDALVVMGLYHIMLAYMFGDPPEPALARQGSSPDERWELDPNHGEAQAAVAIVAVLDGPGLVRGRASLRGAGARACTRVGPRVHELFGLSQPCSERAGWPRPSWELDCAVELDSRRCCTVFFRGRSPDVLAAVRRSRGVVPSGACD